MRRCGRFSARSLSFAERGSPSDTFTIDHGRLPSLEREPAHTAPLAVCREPCATTTAQPAALDDIQEPLSADRSPAQSLPVLDQRLRAGGESWSGEQAWSATGTLDMERRCIRWNENLGRCHPRGPEVTRRPVIDGPVPNMVMIRRVSLQTA